NGIFSRFFCNSIYIWFDIDRRNVAVLPNYLWNISTKVISKLPAVIGLGRLIILKFSRVGQIKNIFLPLTRFLEFVKMRKIAFLSVLSVLFISCGGARPSSFVHNRGKDPEVLSKAIAHRSVSTGENRNSRFSKNKIKQEE